MAREKLQLTVTEQWEGETVGDCLRREAGLSPAQIRSLKFRENGITVNGERVRVSRRLHTGDALVLLLADERNQSGHLIPSEELPAVLYEDEDLVCVDKRPGLVVHPSHGHFQDSLSNQMRSWYLRQGGSCRGGTSDVQVRSIGRLDKDTAGVMVFAKHQIAAARLWKQKEEGSFRKEYLAWCTGAFPEEAMRRELTVTAPIAPAPGELMKMCVPPEPCADAQYACTHYQVLEQSADRALVRLHLETGRTHQIRVHMAHLGHPLVGDPIYGDGIEGKTHAELCAWKAEFLQPFSGKKICVSSEFKVDKSDGRFYK